MYIMKILIMGVSGSGKSSVGQALATELALPFFDADDFHSFEAVAKMASGQPLNDTDRQPWLKRLATLLASENTLVLSCSALKKQYRNTLCQAAPQLQICYLQGLFTTILQRLEARQNQQGHFFTGSSMLRSQFEALEEPEQEGNVLIIPVEWSIQQQIQQICASVSQSQNPMNVIKGKIH